MVGGHLSTSSALLIDRSAEPVESSLPLWQTLAPPSASTRLTTPSCCVPQALSLQGFCAEGSCCQSRRRTLPIHLELVIEVHLSPSIVDSFFLVSHRLAHDVCCLWPLIDCNFLLALVGRRDSQTYTSCSSGFAGVTEHRLERLSSSSAHTADSSRTSRRGSLTFCHFFVGSSRLVEVSLPLAHLCGVFRQLLARCTAVLLLYSMLLFVTPGSGGARCPS